MASRKASARKPDTAMAFVATFFSIIGFLIAIFTTRKDKYVMFYAKQSLVLFVVSAIFSIAGSLPLIGWIFSVFGGILVFVLWLVLWIYALSGEKKEVPILGEFAGKIKL